MLHTGVWRIRELSEPQHTRQYAHGGGLSSGLAGGRGDRERVLADLALVREHDDGLVHGHLVTVVDEALALAEAPEVVVAWHDVAEVVADPGAGDGDVGQHHTVDRCVGDLHAEGPAAEGIIRHRILVFL